MDPTQIQGSIAYCGLVCGLCHLAEECGGCRSAGNSCAKHLSEEGCFQRQCCLKKGLNGCWECDDFPCREDMYGPDYAPKIKAFARCIHEDGGRRFIQGLLALVEQGLDVRLGGDLDGETEARVLDLLRGAGTCQA